MLLKDLHIQMILIGLGVGLRGTRYLHSICFNDDDSGKMIVLDWDIIENSLDSWRIFFPWKNSQETILSP